MTLRWIDNLVIGLVDLYDTKDICELYQHLDIKIIKLSKDNILLRQDEAMYQRNYFDEEIVFIRDDLDYKYEKFILAHELGHAILHTELIAASFNKELINKGKLEKQANYFAVNLLDIELDSIDFEGYTIEQISKALHITEESLIYLVE